MKMKKSLQVITLSALLLFLISLQLALAQGPMDFHERPIPMGVSISTTPSLPYIFTGTAGMRVYHLNRPDAKFILSNNHVIGAVGPTLCPNTAQRRTWILQPGTLDLGLDPGKDRNYAVALLFNKVPIDFGFLANNLVDAAIAYTLPSFADTEILGIGNPNPELYVISLTDSRDIGMEIIKSGRTTGVTTGTIGAVNVTAIVSYGQGCGSARFIRQVVTSASFGDAGDSGSVVLNRDTLTPVGLYFAGSENVGIFSPIHFVYLNLNVFVDGDIGGPTSKQELKAQIAQIQKTHGKDAHMEYVKRVQARQERKIMETDGVVGMGIGLAENSQDLAIIVYCEKLTAQIQQSISKSIEGVSVRLVESGRFEAH